MAQCQPNSMWTEAPTGLEWDSFTRPTGKVYKGTDIIAGWQGVSLGNGAVTIATATDAAAGRAQITPQLRMDGGAWSFLVQGRSIAANNLGFGIQPGEELWHCNWFAIAYLLQEEIGGNYVGGRMSLQYALRITMPPEYKNSQGSGC